MTAYEMTRWPPPYEYHDRVCSCGTSPGHTLHENGFSNACKGCGKYFRYVLYTCSQCRHPYLQTYTHPYRCLNDSRCPEHLREEPCEHEECQRLFSKETLFIREEDRYPLPPPEFTTFNFDF